MKGGSHQSPHTGHQGALDFEPLDRSGQGHVTRLAVSEAGEDRRVERIMASMNPAEAHLLAILIDQVGHANALTAAQLQDRMAAKGIRVSDRQIRQTIKALVEVYRRPICSSPGGKNGRGFFYRATAEEQLQAIENLKRRAMSNLVRMAALKKIGLAELLGQLTIEASKVRGER
ncbi:MAG: hypothetical protein U1B94_01380 [candidate division NC10 bacterium]|nr:hypothetical protein [candidate division NC10 bacterium]